MERTIGLVLLAHFVISAAVQISNLESESFPGSLAINNLSQAMIRATLWFPSGFAGVSGGVILLIALIICAAGWWGRPRCSPEGSCSGQALTVTAVGIAFTIAGFAGLAREGRLGFFEPQFGQPQVTSWVVFAGEIPLAALSVLACAGWPPHGYPERWPIKGPSGGGTADRPHRLGQRGGSRPGRQRAVIISGSNDGTARIWDAATGAPSAIR